MSSQKDISAVTNMLIDIIDNLDSESLIAEERMDNKNVIGKEHEKTTDGEKEDKNTGTRPQGDDDPDSDDFIGLGK